MTQDEIIAMAKEAGFGPHMDLLDDPHFQANAQRLFQKLERFAALVAAKEREECAKLCDAGGGVQYGGETWWNASDVCAEAIRARGTKEGV